MPVTQEYIKNKNGEVISPITSIESIYGKDGTMLLDLFYPVGTYYETSDANFDPNVQWGGSWVQDTEGQVLVSKATSGTFSTLGANVGNENHTLTSGELPNHTHNIGAHSHELNSHTHTYNKSATSTAGHSLTGKELPEWTPTYRYSAYATGNTEGRFALGDVSATNKGTTTGTYGTAITNWPGTGTAHKHTITLSSTNTGAATGSTSNSTAFESGSTGDGNAFSVVQNSKVCIRWHRTA